MIFGKDVLELLKSTSSRWSDHNAPRLGASLAFYMLLSMAPLLIIIVAICGLVFNEASAQQQVLAQIRSLSGSAGEKTFTMLIENANQPKSGIPATVVAFVTLLSGASGVFLELRDSLNIIWDAPKIASSGWQSLIWQRLIAFGMVFALGLLLLTSLILSAALLVVGNFFQGLVPVHFAITGELANLALSFVAMSVFFMLIYKFVPDVAIDWRDVGIGSVVTAVFFAIGKALLGWYMGSVGVGSTYGAAGSLVALVVWVYYSAQIFFFGATFTRVYADTYGSLAAKKRRAESHLHPHVSARTQRA